MVSLYIRIVWELTKTISVKKLICIDKYKGKAHQSKKSSKRWERFKVRHEEESPPK